MPLHRFDPLISRWFTDRFGVPTQPQELGWPEIASGHDTLICAPTGSGKTLAAFLICLDGLVRAARARDLPDETQIIYVSPLKALSNDVHRNLEVPLAEIAAMAKRDGIPLLPIRTSARTGDTPMQERVQMLKKPPHILVTTPESLFILLTAEKSREMLRTVPGHVLGPGHNCVVTGPDGQDVLVYHAWDSARVARSLCIDPLGWTADGPVTDGPTWTETDLQRAVEATPVTG